MLAWLRSTRARSSAVASPLEDMAREALAEWSAREYDREHSCEIHEPSKRMPHWVPKGKVEFFAALLARVQREERERNEAEMREAIRCFVGDPKHFECGHGVPLTEECYEPGGCPLDGFRAALESAPEPPSEVVPPARGRRRP